MIRIEHGDMREVLARLIAEGVTVQSIVTDPPYHLTNRTPDVKWCRDCKRVLGGSDGKPAVCPNCGGVLEYQRSQGQRGFMGRAWDGGDIAFQPETWRLCYDLLPPGGHLLAFSGTRTYHRMACAIEDAGFEIRDTIAWLYGSGFPKSHNVAKGIDKAAGRPIEVVPSGVPVKRMIPGADQAKQGWEKNNGREYQPGQHVPSDEAAAWEGWGTALKPALEPICLARKPLVGTVAGNVQKHGTGALNIDGCRVESERETTRVITRKSERTIYGGYAHDINCDHCGGSGRWPNVPQAECPKCCLKIIGGSEKGRWPANVCHDGSDEVVKAFPDQTSGGTPPRRPEHRNSYMGGFVGQENPDGIGSTSGNASRFFYNAPKTVEDISWIAEPASFAVECSSLQSEAVVSVLSNAVAASMPGSVLLPASYRAPSMSATASEFGLLCDLVTAMILSLGQRFSRGWPLQNTSLMANHAECVAERRQTGTMTITASHWKSDGSVAPVIFDITLPNSERGAKDSRGNRLFYSSKADAADRLQSRHPTVKPVDLMRWLVRLITPKGGTVLDPFAGSGTTGMACMAEGFDCIMVEREAEYAADILRRLAHVRGDDTPLFIKQPEVA